LKSIADWQSVYNTVEAQQEAAAVRAECGHEPGAHSLLVAGPPCQPYSRYTTRNTESHPARYVIDVVKNLIAAELPRAVVVEQILDFRVAAQGPGGARTVSPLQQFLAELKVATKPRKFIYHELVRKLK
jgi:site-specific DNA-cytosine methylase